MNSSILPSVFFEALNHAERMRPYFLLQKQKETGWAKGPFLNALIGLYYDYEIFYSIVFSARRRSHTELTKEEVQVSIKQFLPEAPEMMVSFADIHGVYLSALVAFEIDKPANVYTRTELLSLIEFSLGFIRHEFQVQTDSIKDDGFRPRTDSYFVYEVIQDGPFFHFPTVKEVIRDLLLTTPHPPVLSHLLRTFHEAALEIVKLWNEELSRIEEKANHETPGLSPEIARVEFSGKELSHKWWNDVPEFSVKRRHRYLNSDFAFYAVQVANLLGSEILELPSAKLEQRKPFTYDLITGIQHLLFNGVKETCLRELQEGKRNEASFRNWFSTWFRAKNYVVDAESEKGNGRIDLRLRENEFVHRIIEFKGWWNQDKATVIEQTIKYLTAFEGDGYIVMINHTASSVVEKYKRYIVDSRTGFVTGSWEAMQFEGTAFYYFRSKHKWGPHTKEMYHFIIADHHT